jgi:hypothetical protein
MPKPYIYTPQTYRLPAGNATIPIKKTIVFGGKNTIKRD